MIYKKTEQSIKMFRTFKQFISESDRAWNKEKPGPDPYLTGLDKEAKEDKEEQMKKQAQMDDDDPSAYKEMPGSKEARDSNSLKKSKHTKKYQELYKKNRD